MKQTDLVTFKNFRDMGGLECIDGRKIKQGKLFRAPKIIPETLADMKYLESLKLDCVVDFRCEDELRECPDVLPDGCVYISAPVFSAEDFKYIVVTKKAKRLVLALGKKHADILLNNKLDSYEVMPFSKQSYGKLFECMDEGKTIAFHCTEGKDRTGIAALFIEYALGRDEKDIREEYLRSNIARRNKNRQNLRLIGISQKLIDTVAFCESTHDELFDIAHKVMLEKYPSVPAFLESEYGVTSERAEKWKRYYLESV